MFEGWQELYCSEGLGRLCRCALVRHGRPGESGSPIEFAVVCETSDIMTC